MDGSQVTVAVRPFQAGDERPWDEFVHAHIDGTFFHLSGWKRVIERAFGHRTHYLIAERGHVVTGVLPLTHVKSLLFGSSLISNAFGVQGGPIAEDAESLQRLEAEAVKLMDAITVPVLELRSFSTTRADWPTKNDLYVLFRRALDPSVDRNLKSIPRKQRAMILKGPATICGQRLMMILTGSMVYTAKVFTTLELRYLLRLTFVSCAKNFARRRTLLR